MTRRWPSVPIGGALQDGIFNEPQKQPFCYDEFYFLTKEQNKNILSSNTEENR